MSQATTTTRAAPAAEPPAPARGRRRGRVAAAFALAGVAPLAVAATHLTQGTAAVGALDLLRLAFGGDEPDTTRILVASRLPRLLAGAVVGVALGVAGGGLQSLARNPLASPDTLAVNAGAYLTVVGAAALGLRLPVLPAGALAFLGGLAAAGLVLVVAAAGRSGPTRVVLAGTAIAMSLNSLTYLLLIVGEQETVGLFAWGNGSLVQGDLAAVRQMAPLVALAVAGFLLIGRRLDVLALGDDAASVLGIDVRRTRLYLTLLSVLLAAAAVTLVGPVGFVGLCAPVIVRPLVPWAPGLHRHRAMLPLAGLVGVLVVLGADVLLRAALGGQAGVDVPTGAVTTAVGAAALIWLARRHRDAGPTRRPPTVRSAATRSRAYFWIVAAVCVALAVIALVVGLLAGDTWLLGGDVVNWLRGRTGPAYTFVLDQRYPRVAAALLAGAALAVAGTAVQAVCRNPLAEPSLLGVTGGAGVAAVALLSFAPLAGVWTMSAAAGAGALLAFALVYGMSWRGAER